MSHTIATWRQEGNGPTGPAEASAVLSRPRLLTWKHMMAVTMSPSLTNEWSIDLRPPLQQATKAPSSRHIKLNSVGFLFSVWGCVGGAFFGRRVFWPKNGARFLPSILRQRGEREKREKERIYIVCPITARSKEQFQSSRVVWISLKKSGRGYRIRRALLKTMTMISKQNNGGGRAGAMEVDHGFDHWGFDHYNQKP